MVLKINHCSVYTTDIDWDHNHVRDHLEASNFKELSADCFQKSHSMLEAGSSNLCVKMKWPTSCHCKRSVVTTFLQTLCEQDGIDRYGWQRPFTKRQIAAAMGMNQCSILSIALCFERKKIFFDTLHYAAGN